MLAVPPLHFAKFYPALEQLDHHIFLVRTFPATLPLLESDENMIIGYDTDAVQIHTV